MAQSKAVAKKDEAALPAQTTGFDYGEFADYGDNPNAEDLLIPLLRILQPMSPEVTEGEVEGAKAGMYYNTVTGDLYDGTKGIPFQPVHFDKMFVEWVPREDGGGIAGRYNADDKFIQDLKKENGGSVVGLKNGKNDVVETYYVYGNILSEDGKEVEGFAVMPVKSTSIKPLRAWRTAMQMIKGKPPVFAFRALLKNTKEKNDSGTWWQFQAKPFGASWKESLINPKEERDLLEAGQGLLDMIATGQAKADFAKEETAGAPEGEEAAPF
jgi:hypothetical protein